MIDLLATARDHREAESLSLGRARGLRLEAHRLGVIASQWRRAMRESRTESAREAARLAMERVEGGVDAAIQEAERAEARAAQFHRAAIEAERLAGPEQLGLSFGGTDEAA